MSKTEENTSLRLSALEDNILTLLSCRDELYGLEIAEEIKEASEGKRSLSIGSLYPTLHRMLSKGLIESIVSIKPTKEHGGTPRRYYKITGFGAKVLAETEHMRERLKSPKPAIQGAY